MARPKRLSAKVRLAGGRKQRPAHRGDRAELGVARTDGPGLRPSTAAQQGLLLLGRGDGRIWR